MLARPVLCPRKRKNKHRSNPLQPRRLACLFLHCSGIPGAHYIYNTSCGYDVCSLVLFGREVIRDGITTTRLLILMVAFPLRTGSAVHVFTLYLPGLFSSIEIPFGLNTKPIFYHEVILLISIITNQENELRTSTEYDSTIIIITIINNNPNLYGTDYYPGKVIITAGK